MATAYGNATIGATAAVIADGSSRDHITVKNNHATNILYVGFNSSVTTANGLSVAAGASVTIDGYDGPVYGIASAVSTDVRYIEVEG